MTTRRELLLALGALAALPAHSQQPGKVWRIGLLASGTRPASLESGTLGEFPRAMRQMGYVEGKNFIIDWRFAEGKIERFPELATQLVQLNVDVMIAVTPGAVSAARQATTTIPIIMVAVADPIGFGFVASLSRPGGNITGFSNLSSDVSPKYLELLRATIPKLARVAVLVNRDVANQRLVLERIEGAAKTIGVSISPFDVKTVTQIEVAIRAMPRERIGAIIVVADLFFSAQAPRIAELALKDRLPTMFWTREHVVSGGLMSYGQDNAEHYRRAAVYVDKILKGAKPGDLPVEQAAKLELVINRNTAKAMGLTISRELLLRADEVIE